MEREVLAARGVEVAALLELLTETLERMQVEEVGPEEGEEEEIPD